MIDNLVVNAFLFLYHLKATSLIDHILVLSHRSGDACVVVSV